MAKASGVLMPGAFLFGDLCEVFAFYSAKTTIVHIFPSLRKRPDTFPYLYFDFLIRTVIY
jgi:hypothetical protein